MNQKSYLLLIISFSVVSNLVTAEPKLPSFIKVCRRSDPYLNECIKNSVENLRPLLARGIPEFHIPTCEPLSISEVVIDQGTGPVAVRSTYRDVEVYGPSKFALRYVKMEMERDRIKIKLWLPRLEVNSKYRMEGRILMMPIAGTGTSRGNYTNIDATVIMQGQRIKKDNETYFHIRDFYVDFNIGHATVQLDDLFNGDKELGEAMNLFLNDNWKNVANEIKPVLEDTIANIFKKLSNKIFHKYPLNLLLPR